METYITFSVPIKKQYDEEKAITHKLRFIDSFKFMSASLSDLVDNMSGVFNSIECTEKVKINLECCFVGLKSTRCREFKKEWKRPI